MTLYWLPGILSGMSIILSLNPTTENLTLSPFSTTMENTPWLLVIVPRPLSSTITLAPGMACKLSAVITTPYNCTTESFFTCNCAVAYCEKQSNKTIERYCTKCFISDKLPLFSVKDKITSIGSNFALAIVYLTKICVMTESEILKALSNVQEP